MSAIGSGTFDTSAFKPERPRDYRLPLVILLLVILTISFWSGSRYPALEEKALMGGDTPLSGLSFDIVVEILPGASFLSALWANTINWIFTNLKGMTFGVLFGSMALTLLSLLQKRSFKNGFANSALGVMIGAPLGVCVNCAVPIALGLHAGRLRLETTLSAMLASPTLNVIVVTMSFALLPVEIAAVKLLASLVMVLVGVPLLCRFVLKEESEATHDASAASAAGQKLGGISGWLMRNLAPRDYQAGEFGLPGSIVWFVRHYARNFLFIFIVTVPMMFLAAFLGALLIEIFAPNTLVSLMPRNGVFAILFAMLLLALIASMVPAPIALDVILTIVILNLGLVDFYGATLVVALGSFSIYAFIIIWRAISLRTALSLWAMVIAVSVCAGCAAIVLGGPAKKYKFDTYRAIMAAEGAAEWPALRDTEKAVPISAMRSALAAQTVERRTLSFGQSGNAPVAAIEALAMPDASATTSGPNFGRVVGREIGIGVGDQLNSLSRSFLHLFDGGIAAGDIHGDGWTDIALRKSFLDKGVAIYANIGGRFVRQQANLGPVDEATPFVVAFGDIDGDGALDMVVTTDGHGNYLFYNRGGSFDIADSVKLPGDDRALTRSLAFADFDRDGRLDIALGNGGLVMASAGFGTRQTDIARNHFLFNRGDGQFEDRPVDSFPGQTLTLLTGDFNRDGILDLLFGDDVGNTDAFVLFARDGSFHIAKGKEVPFPYRVQSSMSYDEGDWNNDLLPDYYGVQIASRSQALGTADRIRNLGALCRQVASDSGWSSEDERGCLRQLNAITQLKGAYQAGLQTGCDLMPDRTHRIQCAARALFQHYYQNRGNAPDKAGYASCRKEMASTPRLLAVCESLLLPMEDRAKPDLVETELGPVMRDNNILMSSRPDGSFADDAKAQNVRQPGWSWDSKFADLDQDGWQDLLVLNGWWGRAPEGDSNQFFHNERGRLVEASEKFGLSDPIPSISAVRFDFDRDGDIDLIRSLSGPNVIAHRNDRPAGNALWVNLRQKGGNTMGIGARVTICIDGETKVRRGKCQTRPVKASGGFQSFDPIAAHFGLGKARNISLIEVVWPDGKRSMLSPQKLSGGEIVIRR